MLLIMLDDVGFEQTGTFGAPIPTPALDKLAANGLRYTRFHTTAFCGPSRAALITGGNHHNAGSGFLADWATGFPSYNNMIPKTTASIAATLKGNGYATSWFGKNRNTPDWESSVAGPFDRWPAGMGSSISTASSAERRTSIIRSSSKTPGRSSRTPRQRKSWTITADVEVPEGGGNGMIATEGGLEGGIGLCLRDGRSTFVYNFRSLKRPTFAGKDSLPEGKSQIAVKFDDDGGGAGTGAMVSRGCWSSTPTNGCCLPGFPARTGPSQQ